MPRTSAAHSPRLWSWAVMCEAIPSPTSPGINWTGGNEHSWIKTQDPLPVAPIVDEIANQTAIEGDNVRFTCNIIHSDSQTVLQWFQHYNVKDSYVDEKGTPNVKLLQQSGYMKTIDDPQSLVLRNVSRKDEGWYTCIVTNTIGMNYKSD